jgi:hypothetical protein
VASSDGMVMNSGEVMSLGVDDIEIMEEIEKVGKN